MNTYTLHCCICVWEQRENSRLNLLWVIGRATFLTLEYAQQINYWNSTKKKILNIRTNTNESTKEKWMNGKRKKREHVVVDDDDHHHDDERQAHNVHRTLQTQSLAFSFDISCSRSHSCTFLSLIVSHTTVKIIYSKFVQTSAHICAHIH